MSLNRIARLEVSSIHKKFIIVPHVSRKTLLTIVVAVVATITGSSIVSVILSTITGLQIPSFGTIKAVGVEAYWDKNIENRTMRIDWGTIGLGSQQDVTIYIRSISNVDTTLHLNTTDWIPAEISQYLTLLWNYDDETIHPRDIIQITLTLSASSSYSFFEYLITNAVKSFSFDIQINAD